MDIIDERLDMTSIMPQKKSAKMTDFDFLKFF